MRAKTMHNNNNVVPYIDIYIYIYIYIYIPLTCFLAT